MNDILPLMLRPAQTDDVAANEPALSPLDRSWRTKGTANALLKNAYNQLERAERVIVEQSKRIQQLEDLAATDPLTGLMNRRGFEKFFANELSRIRRGNSPGALFVLIDLDRFKPLNDIYGHLAGDACLRLAADNLLKSIRLADGAARFGGDEFALLLSQTDAERALARVKQVKEMLNTLCLEWKGSKLFFGASVGYAPLIQTSDFVRVYQEADQALFADKKLRKGKL